MKVDFLRKAGVVSFLAFTVLYAICLGFIFGGTWALDVTVVQPDAGNAFSMDQLSRNWRALLQGTGHFIPGDVLGLLGSPYFWQELRYALAAYISALGVVYYLRGRDLPWLAAYGGGAAYGLMGYSFTLFSAGHMGWFHWLMYGPFAFGLVDRALRGGQWRHWALLGGVLAWGASRQPDMWLLFAALTFAYGVWCLVREARAGGLARVAGARGIKGLCVGVAATALVMLLAGAPAFWSALTESLTSRDKQIAESSGRRPAAEQTASADTTEGDAERWRFCTSWSLPPEDILEFAVPRINGDTSDVNIIELRRRAGWRETRPYAGRLGMPAPGADGRIARWIPYRQHSLYFGLVTLLFAVWGVVAACRRRDANRGETFFWAIAAVLSLFCAMGCFTPFYRLVYALPFGSYLRAPVKFVHLVEFCVAVLAGFGMSGVLRRFAAVKAVFWIVLVLAVANVLDLARIDALYAGPENIAFPRASNAAADEVRRRGGGKTAILFTPQEGARTIGDSFNCHLAPTADLNAAGGDPMKADARFFFVSGSVFAKDSALTALVKTGKLVVAGTYALSGREGIVSVPSSKAQAVLLEIPGRPGAADELPTPPLKRTINYISLAVTLTLLAWLACSIVLPRRTERADQ